MAYVGILICTIGAIYGWKIHRKKLNPLFVFLTLWGIILTLSLLHLYWLNETGERTYFVIAVGILFFTLGYYFAYRKIRFKSIERAKNVMSNGVYRTYRPVYIWIYMLGFLTIVLYVKDLSKVLPHMLSGNILAQIRSMAQNSESALYEGRSTLETALRMLIIQPFVMALQPIVAVEFWTKSNCRWKLLFLDFIIVLLRMFTDGSRGMVLYLGMHLVITFAFLNTTSKDLLFSYYSKYINSSKRARRWMKLLLIFFIIVFVFSTMSRSGGRFWRNLYYDFSMEPYLMETWMNEIDHYGFGTASLNGIVYPFIYFIKNALRLNSYPVYWYENIFMLINDTDQIWQCITSGVNTYANAYVSIFWFPYLDGGILGVCIGLLLYGMTAGYFFKYAIRATSKKSICLYSYFMQGIFMSFVRMQFASTTYALGFVYLIILGYRKSRKRCC